MIILCQDSSTDEDYVFDFFDVLAEDTYEVMSMIKKVNSCAEGKRGRGKAIDRRCYKVSITDSTCQERQLPKKVRRRNPGDGEDEDYVFDTA